MLFSIAGDVKVGAMVAEERVARVFEERRLKSMGRRGVGRKKDGEDLGALLRCPVDQRPCERTPLQYYEFTPASVVGVIEQSEEKGSAVVSKNCQIPLRLPVLPAQSDETPT